MFVSIRFAIPVALGVALFCAPDLSCAPGRLATSAGAQTQEVVEATPQHTVVLPPGWQSSEPGFPVQVLLGRGSAMWAAGSGESIAVSTDGGKHWQAKHQDAKGSMLLVLNFVNESFGYAAGTSGRVLFTEDGGQTWTVHDMADDTIVQAAFGDENHGVIRMLGALVSTFNGGKSWNQIIPDNDLEWLGKFPFTVDMAALDQDHLAVRVSAGLTRDGEYLWTDTGGMSWHANYIGNSVISTLFTAAGNYWSVGHSVLSHQANRRDQFGAGYAAPMTFHSRNGIEWEHNPLSWEACHWHDCQGCTPQGCFAGKTSFLAFHENRDGMANVKMFKFPAHEELSSEWAQSGDALCLMARSSVQCTRLEPIADLDTHDDSPSWFDRSLVAIGKYHVSFPKCIRCELDPIYVTHEGESGQLDLAFSLTLEPTGVVREADIQGGLPADLRTKIEGQLANWLFEPYFKDGLSSEAYLNLPNHIMVLNPARPADHSFLLLLPDPHTHPQ